MRVAMTLSSSYKKTCQMQDDRATDSVAYLARHQRMCVVVGFLSSK